VFENLLSIFLSALSTANRSAGVLIEVERNIEDNLLITIQAKGYNLTCKELDEAFASNAILSELVSAPLSSGKLSDPGTVNGSVENF
jgi:hypothetical protein